MLLGIRNGFYDFIFARHGADKSRRATKAHSAIEFERDVFENVYHTFSIPAYACEKYLKSVQFTPMGNVHKTPFAALGSALRAIRQRAKESAAELSSAIEITDERLQKFEAGELRPSEDILELVIAHYALSDREADKLWDLAGYGNKKQEPSLGEDPIFGSQQTVMVMPFDARIVYTDMVHVMVNNYGVIMNFMQGAGPNNQPLAVARIGMSREHAKSVLEVLQKTLNDADAPTSSTKFLQSPNVDTNTP